jgi:asparagine synthase (glutamine-hydrolysing)
MCGITGFYTKKNNFDSEIILNNMLELISHRGKNNRGIYVDINPDSNETFAVGHNRLSVIDLSDSGNQPFLYKDYIISYNGEIYNYEELRNNLIERGYSFNSSSDTEVIIKLFEAYGKKSFEKLNGMFAIVIYNKKTQKLYLTRDRMGVKPLLFYKDNDSFLFSSELKSFYAFPNFKQNCGIKKNMLANYFKYGYINSFDSIIEGVHKVENGSFLIYDLQKNEVEKRKYWILSNVKELEKLNKTDYITKDLFDLLKSSVSLRLVSDLPVGLFLSSGIDSNLVLNLSLLSGLKKLDTYTLRSIDYEDNDLAYNNKVNRNFITTDLNNIWKDYKYLCSKYDEPFSDPATIGLFQLSKSASKFNKVIMVGDGGDEILAGYSTYKLFASINSLKFRVARLLYKPFHPFVKLYITKFVESKTSKRLSHYHSILSSKSISNIQKLRENFYNSFTKRIVGDVFPDSAELNNNEDNILTNLNYKTSSELIHQLNYKTDIAGMLNTVEIREPLLDYRLFEFQQRISIDFFNNMVKNKESKFFFRKILNDKFNIDTSTLQKKGFHVRLEQAFKENINEINSLIMNHKSINIDMNYVGKTWGLWKTGNVDFTIINRIVTYILWEKNFNKS